jgi:hypothetical protein
MLGYLIITENYQNHRKLFNFVFIINKLLNAKSTKISKKVPVVRKHLQFLKYFPKLQHNFIDLAIESH